MLYAKTCQGDWGAATAAQGERQEVDLGRNSPVNWATAGIA